MIDKRLKKYCKYISILGTRYRVVFDNEENDTELAECFGYVRYSSKEIVLDQLYTNSKWASETKAEIDFQIKKTLRHEIIHAFFFESGLDKNSNTISGWARNEEMVDWFAIQSPKIFKVYEELECL